MDHSIQDIARLAGTTSRTLRHYGAETGARFVRDALTLYVDRTL